MLKTNVMQRAMLYIGETSDYQSNSGEIYDIADFLLDGIVRTISTDESFLFNAKTHELSEKEEGGGLDIPSDFLSLVSSDGNLMRVGDKFVGDATRMIYCSRLPFKEIPDQLETLIAIKLALEVSLSNSTFEDKTDRLNSMYESEKSSILNSQSYFFDYYND